MALREILLPWGSQPQDAAVAPSEWAISRQLQLLVAADPQFDIASGRFTATTVVTGTPSISPSRIGLAYSSTSGASSVNRTGDLLLRASWTALILASPAASTNQAGVLNQTGTDVQRIGFNFNDQFTAASGRFSVTLLDTGVNRSHAYVASAADGLPHAFLMRKNGTTVTAWIDGVSRTVTSSGGFTGSPGATTDTIRLYGDSADGIWALIGASVSGTAFFGAALTDAECAELSTLDAAWGMLLQPRRAFVPYTVAASSLPTLSAATYVPGSLTASGFRPRVTATY